MLEKRLNQQDVLVPRPTAEKICYCLEFSCHKLHSPIKCVNTPDCEGYIEIRDETMCLRENVKL